MRRAMIHNDDATTEAAHVTSAILETIFALEDQGVPLSLILATAHAEIVSAIALAYGGPAAAQSCNAAARRFAVHPSLAQAMFRAEPLAGRA